MHRIERMKRWS